MKPTLVMPQIPIYLKTSADMPRPQDPEFYWFTRSGLFLCRNYAFFQSDSPAQRMPGSLAAHQPACRAAFPLLGAAALEYAVGFFDEVFIRYGAEAIVLVLWDQRRHRYRLCVPPQRASVWQSTNGLPCAIDVAYEIPTPLPRDHLLIGDIHSHADLQAYSSYTDAHDERHRDGVHAVIGRIDREPPEFHVEMAVDGTRFPLAFGQFFQGYRARRRHVPKAWLRRVEVHVKRWSWTNTYTTSGYPNGAGSNKPPGSSPRHKNSNWGEQA